MKRILVIKIAALCICLASPAFAQFRANSFSKPAIAEAVNPVVGKGGQYQTIHSGQSGTSSELQEFTVVGKEMVDGKEGFWLEIVHQGKGNSGLRYAKVLFTKDDFQFHKMIVQQPGQQPIATPFPTGDGTRSQMSAEAEQWHAVGTESITVPAGTFSCKHWKKSKSATDGASDIWTNTEISPFGIVKEVSPGHTMVLVKVITDARDHITGAAKTYSPEEMKRNMMEKTPQAQQQKP